MEGGLGSSRLRSSHSNTRFASQELRSEAPKPNPNPNDSNHNPNPNPNWRLLGRPGLNASMDSLLLRCVRWAFAPILQVYSAPYPNPNPDPNPNPNPSPNPNSLGLFGSLRCVFFEAFFECKDSR